MGSWQADTPKKLFIIKIKSEAIPSEFTFTNGENNGVAK